MYPSPQHKSTHLICSNGTELANWKRVDGDTEDSIMGILTQIQHTFCWADVVAWDLR